MKYSLMAAAFLILLTTCKPSANSKGMDYLENDKEFTELWMEEALAPEEGLVRFWQTEESHYLALSPYIRDSYDFLKAMIPLAKDAGLTDWDLEILIEDDLLDPRYSFSESVDLLEYVKKINEQDRENPVRFVKTGAQITVRDLTTMPHGKDGILLYFPQHHIKGKEDHRSHNTVFSLNWNNIENKLPSYNLPGLLAMKTDLPILSLISSDSVFTENNFSEINIFIWKNTADLDLVTWQLGNLINDSNRLLYKSHIPESVYVKDNDEINRFFKKLFASAGKAILPELEQSTTTTK